MLVLYCGILLTLYVRRVSGYYEIYHLESLCSNGNNKVTIQINPWKAVIFYVGHLRNKDGSPASYSLHSCKVPVVTHKDFGLTAVIEEMMIKGTKNKDTGGWKCQKDYVKLRTDGDSSISKFFDFLPGDALKNKATEELCGIRKRKSFFTDIGSNANILSTLADNMEIVFHQHHDKSNPVNNSFTIIITSYKHSEDDEACRGKYACYGKNICIDPAYVCDDHYNCGFPNGGGDERHCVGQPFYHPIFSTTTTIITVLASVVGAGLIVCCMFTLVRKIKSLNTTRTGTPVSTGLSLEASAPSLQRQHTLPCYEAVVMSDISQSAKSGDPASPGLGELPPAYQFLFPDGPPSDVNPVNANTNTTQVGATGSTHTNADTTHLAATHTNAS